MWNWNCWYQWWPRALSSSIDRKLCSFASLFVSYPKSSAQLPNQVIDRVVRHLNATFWRILRKIVPSLSVVTKWFRTNFSIDYWSLSSLKLLVDLNWKRLQILWNIWYEFLHCFNSIKPTFLLQSLPVRCPTV